MYLLNTKFTSIFGFYERSTLKQGYKFSIFFDCESEANANFSNFF